MLLHINNVLTPQQINAMREKLEQAEWVDGKITAGNQAATIKSNLQLDDHSPVAQELSNSLLSILGNHPQFIAGALPHKIFPPKFNCYQDGGCYGKHVDNAVMALPNSQQLLRTDLSATLFLSEPEDYDGGELTIETNYGEQTVKLAAGDLVLYPSTSLHQVTPVSRGSRMCAFFWIQSMVRDAGHRGMLYDLDQSIQTLSRERGLEYSEVNKLTGIYHNLVREWAET